MSEEVLLVISDVKLLLKSLVMLTNTFIRTWLTSTEVVFSPHHIYKRRKLPEKTHIASFFSLTVFMWLAF